MKIILSVHTYRKVFVRGIFKGFILLQKLYSKLITVFVEFYKEPLKVPSLRQTEEQSEEPSRVPKLKKKKNTAMLDLR